MKKILSLVLAALMIFSVLPVAFADEAVTTEAPAVEEVSEFQEAIDFLKLLGIYVGTSEETFVAAAKEPVNRAQMALFTSRFITGQVDPAYWMTSENDSGFTDIEDLYEEAIGAISFASQKGIVNGVGEGLFDPETGVQYREAITMIVRALGYTYKASGYPWSYINKAREIGLLDGITGINYTTQINREVVAQLLYNALFVEIDGTTVAESAFNVGKTVVLITASNRVVYEAGASVVSRKNFVRFAEIDEQGEPVGADYHVAMDQFALASAVEANAAVGTLYSVYYKDTCAEIISAESLSKTYWNLGNEKQEITVKDGKITLGGNTYKLVTKYTDLNRNQGTNTGDFEMKAYSPAGIKTTGIADGYIISANGDIYKVGDLQDFFKPYATYSPVLDKYYGYDENGNWKIFTDEEIDAILNVAKNEVKGFALTTAPSVSAYTEATVSGNDRVIVREYYFGKLIRGKADKSSKEKNVPNFTLQSNLTGKTAEFTTIVDKAWTADYSWTGIQYTDLPSDNSYVIYYVDRVNKEIDVLEVIGAKESAEDDSYLVTGYIRGFDLANNALTFGVDYTAYNYDYDNLKGGVIKSKAANDKSTSKNWAYFQNFLNEYVTLVVVDGKVVKIDLASEDNDFVIIDSFVAFEEDGIIANAWTTVSNEYTQIKIGSYNGWTVGGFDYTYYILTGFVNADKAAQLIPIKTYDYYRVVDVVDGVYDLTTAAPSATDKTITVNQYGYIEGIDKDGKFQSYVATSDNDYWLILDETGAKPVVYSLTGKVNPVVTLTNVDFYKSKGDFVIEIGNGRMDATNNFYGKNVAFYKYNRVVDLYSNQDYLNQLNPYNYSLYMTNMLTGIVEPVQLGNTGIFNNNFTATEMYGKLVESGIYMAIDGVVVDVDTTYELAEVAAYYGENFSQYTQLTTENVAGKTTDAIIDALSSKIGAIITPGFAADDTNFKGNVTVFENAKTLSKITVDTNATYGSDHVYNMYIILSKDNKIVAWVEEGDYAVAKAKNVPVTAYSAGTVTNGVFSSTNVWDGNVCDTMSYWKDDTTEYFYSTITFNPERQLSFADKAAYEAAEAGMTVDVVFADGTTAKYTPASAEATSTPDGICIAIPPVFDGLPGDASPFLIVNFAMNLEAHGFVKSYTVTIDKGPGAAVQLTVVNPNF